MSFRKWLLLAMVAILATAFVAPAADLAPEPESRQIAKQLAKMLPYAHLLQTPMDATISERAWTNYLNALDYDHIYFLQSDIARFATNRLTIAASLQQGDVQFGYDVFNVFRQRVRESDGVISNLLAAGFDFTVNETYNWKTKDAPWPKDRAEQKERWRKRIKNEYLVHEIARELDAKNAASATGAVAAATNTVASVASTNVTTAVSSATTSNAPSSPLPTPEELVRKHYEMFHVVLQDSDPEFVLSRYLTAFSEAYDPHTEYMSPDKMDEFNIDMSLSLCGIGAQLRADEGAAKIEELIPGGPAARDTRSIHLCSGDKIIGVGQGSGSIESVLHLPLGKTVRKIRGEKGTRVVLNVISANDSSRTRLVDLIRDEVKLEEQAATGRVERVVMPNGHTNKLGVVRLPAFYGTMQQRPNDPGYRSAALDVMRILGMLNAENVDGIVLDLRNNGGGSLREAIDLASAFIRDGPVVQVKEVHQIHVLPVSDAGPMVAFRRPMVLLVNRTSASASEIVAGALQDYGRAVVVGDPKTHGKGSVQTILPLGSEKMGQLKVTTANYYRISGLSTQLKGVHPDIVIPSIFDTLDLGEDTLPNAMPWSCVPSLEYTMVWDLGKWLPTLRARSAERLTKNPRYLQYCRLVQHIRAMNEQTEMPLEKTARMKLSATEAEIQKMENEETRLDTATTTTRDDVILDESLHILADLVDVSGRAEMPWDDKSDLRRQMMRLFGAGM